MNETHIELLTDEELEAVVGAGPVDDVIAFVSQTVQC